MALSHSFPHQPETNGVAKRFFRTLKEQVIYGGIFRTAAEVIRHPLQRVLAPRPARLHEPARLPGALRSRSDLSDGSMNDPVVRSECDRSRRSLIAGNWQEQKAVCQSRFLGSIWGAVLRPDLPKAGTGARSGGQKRRVVHAAGAEPRAARRFAGEPGEHPPFDGCEHAGRLGAGRGEDSPPCPCAGLGHTAHRDVTEGGRWYYRTRSGQHATARGAKPAKASASAPCA